MSKYLNMGDALLIAFSAYVVVWGINAILRNSNMGVYQA
jgi:hypothetical protein